MYVFKNELFGNFTNMDLELTVLFISVAIYCRRLRISTGYKRKHEQALYFEFGNMLLREVNKVLLFLGDRKIQRSLVLPMHCLIEPRVKLK